KADADMRRIRQSAEGMQRQLSTVFGAALAGFGVRELVQIADSWTSINNRLRLVTASTAELTQVQERLFAVSQETRSSFEATADLYAAIARNARELGRSQDELVTLTRSINQAIQISGVSAA